MTTPLSLSALDQLPQSVETPGYRRDDLSPGILHVGVGNFHRAHMGYYLDRLFELGESHDWALVGAGVRAGDSVMRARLERQDWLTTLIELDPKGLNARVIGSMIDFVDVDPQSVIAAMADPAIRILSLTITEGGYYVDAKTDGFDASHPDMVHDAAHPDEPKSVFGMILAALRRRRAAGLPPLPSCPVTTCPKTAMSAPARSLNWHSCPIPIWRFGCATMWPSPTPWSIASRLQPRIAKGPLCANVSGSATMPSSFASLSGNGSWRTTSPGPSCAGTRRCRICQ